MAKKLLTALAAVIIVIAICIAALFTVSQTPYSAKLANYLLQQRYGNDVQIESVCYQAPFHFTVKGLTLQTNSNPIYIPQTDIWFNSSIFQDNKLQIDSVLIDGLSLQDQELAKLPIDNIELHQLALNNFDFSNQDVVARGVNVQIKQPHWDKPTQHIPFGDIQLSAEQIYYYGEALNSLLIDAELKQENSTIYGASFRWRGADISGQAEQFPQGWSLINVTINHLVQPDTDVLSQVQPVVAPWLANIYHINSLDILGSSFRFAGVTLTNLDASLENLELSRSAWEQPEAYLSFNAESIELRQQKVISPTATLNFKPDTIEIEDFDSDYLQGRVQLSGRLSPSDIHLSTLRLTGLKLLEDTEDTLQFISDYLGEPDTHFVDDLEINRSQIIQLEQSPYWQLSGVSVEGKELELIREQKLGLWQGKLSASANSLSYGDTSATQAIFSAQSHQGLWQVDRLFVPLEQGYLDVTGQWDRQQPSAPWQLSIHGDGLPTELFSYTKLLPFKLDGLAELELELQGLSGDQSALAHSLSGQVALKLRDSLLVIQEQQSQHNRTLFQPLDSASIHAKADRGRVTITSTNIEGTELNANFSGELDLVSPEQATLTLEIKQKCQTVTSNVLSGINQFADNCSEKESEAVD